MKYNFILIIIILYIFYVSLYIYYIGLGYDRYKFIVQVLIGERRDQGVRMGTKCFWDAGTDNQATENFMNVSFILYDIYDSYFNCISN